MQLDWKKLYFGRVSRQEVAEAVSDVRWQAVRERMKNVSLEDKYKMLSVYLRGETLWAQYASLPEKERERILRMAQVRCTNYVTALSRGGLIKPEDYR